MLEKITKKFTNTKTIIATVSIIILILTEWGVDVPNDKIMTTVKGLCTLGVMYGVLNDTGMKTTKWNQ